MSMNPKIKEKWLARLRDPNAKQARGRLAKVREDGRILGQCCLGVLCEIAVEEGVIPAGVVVKDFDSHEAQGFAMQYGAEGMEGFLPKEVAQWADIGSDGAIPGQSVTWTTRTREQKGHHSKFFTLAALNDSGAKFKTIANVIEERF